MICCAFIWFFLVSVSSTCINEKRENLTHTDISPGEMSFGVRILDTFLEMQPVSLWTCVEECMRRKGCLSFNFIEKINYCELNYKDKNTGILETNATTSGLFIQSDISSWENHKHIIGNCRNHMCPYKHKCNTSGLCEMSDCGQAPSISVKHSVVVGQGDHRIGNGVFVGCEEPFVMRDHNAILPGEIIPIKCNSNGDWEIPLLSCDNIYTFDDHWYFFGRTYKTWLSAKSFCHGMNFHLVEINNQRENDWLKIEMGKRSMSLVWTGGIARGKKWVWEASDSDMIWLNWNPGQPQNLYKQNCMIMSLSIDWYVFSCDFQFDGFICEH